MAWECTNADSWIELNSGAGIVQSGEVTYSFWYKLSGAISNTDDMSAVSVGLSTGGCRRASFAGTVEGSNNPNSANPGVGGRYRAGNGTSYYTGTTTEPASGTWHHVLMTIENQGSASSYFVRVIVDGGTEEVDTYSGFGDDSSDQARYFNVACQALGTDAGRNFIGKIADVAVWGQLPTDRAAMASALYSASESGVYADNAAVTTHIGDTQPVLYNRMESAPSNWDSIPNEGSHSGNWDRVGTNVTHVADHPTLTEGGIPIQPWSLLGGGGIMPMEPRIWTGNVYRPLDVVFLIPGLVDDPIARENDGLSTTCTWVADLILPDFVSEGLIYDGRTADGDTRYIARFTPQANSGGNWTLTTSGSTETALNGLTAEVVAANPLSGYEGRGHVDRTTGDQRFRYQNGDQCVPNVVMMPAPASTLSVAGPPAVTWDSFWNHVGGDPEQGSVDTAVVDTYLDEFVGASSNHKFNGFEFLVHGGWFDDGIIAPNAFGFPTSSQKMSLETFRCLEYMIQAVHARGGVTVILYGPDENDGHENNLPGGFNGTDATRLQDYIAARLMPLPGWILSYGYDCWEFNGGGPGNPTAVAAVFDPFIANLKSRNDYTTPIGIRNYNAQIGDVLTGTADCWILENYKPGSQVNRGGASSHPGQEGILEYDPTSQGIKPTFGDDRHRVRPQNGSTTKDYVGSQTSLLLAHSYVSGSGVGGVYGDLTNNPSGSGGQPARQKEFQDYSNDGLAPSNIYDNPFDWPGDDNERLRIAKVQSFFEWNVPNNGYSNSRRYSLSGVARVGSPWTDHTDNGTDTESGTTCCELADGDYTLYVENDNEVNVRLDSGGLNMTNDSIGGIAVQVDADAQPVGTFLDLGMIDRGTGMQTIALGATGNWMVHLSSDYDILQVPFGSTGSSVTTVTLETNVLPITPPALESAGSSVTTVAEMNVWVEIPLSESVGSSMTLADALFVNLEAFSYESNGFGLCSVFLTKNFESFALDSRGESETLANLLLPLTAPSSSLGFSITTSGLEKANQPRVQGRSVATSETAAGLVRNPAVNFASAGSSGSSASLSSLGQVIVTSSSVGRGVTTAPFFSGSPELAALSIGIGRTTATVSRTSAFMCDITDLWNNTLTILGSNHKISAVNEASAEAEAIRCVWDELKRAFLVEHAWDGSVKTVDLSEEVGAEGVSHYTMVFATPLDLLRPLTVNDTPWEKSTTAWEQQVSPQTGRNVFYAVEPLELFYVFDIQDEVCMLAPKVREALAFKLAKRLAKKFGHNAADRDRLDADYNAALVDAKSIDSYAGSPKKRAQSRVLDQRKRSALSSRWRPRGS